MRGFERPAVVLTMLVTIIVAAVAMTILAASRLPTLGIEPIDPSNAAFRLADAPAMPSFRIAAVRGPRGQVGAVVDADMIDPVSMAPNDRQMRRMAALAAAAQGDRVTVIATRGAQTFPIVRRVERIGLGGIAGEGWGIIAVTALCAFIGAWIVAVRPQNWATTMVALSGFGLLLAGLPVAISVSVEWIVAPVTIAWCARINTVAAMIFGSALMGLFARYPRPVMGWRGLAALQAVVAVPAAISLVIADLEIANRAAAVYVVVVIVVLAVLTIWQWLASRRDPLARAYLRWVGAVLLICASAYALMFVVPVALGTPPLVGVVLSFALFLPFYLALVAGVVRFRAFDLERWSLALLVGAAITIAMIAVDLLLVLALNLAPGRAGIAVISGFGLCWLFVRDRVRARLLGRRPAIASDLLGRAVTVALADTMAAREAGWQAALKDLFLPLAVGPAAVGDDDGDAIRIEDDGLTLIVPTFASRTGIALRFANHGHRLFSKGDVALVGELLTLVRLVDERRVAYDRGVVAERRRIAQDLHDDVGGRLVTSLHRSSHDAARDDIRDALAEMRTIISGLVGHAMPLAAALATLRRDAAERLEAAGIGLDWHGDVESDASIVDGRVLKALASILRELTTNTLLHARASVVDIKIMVEEAILTLVFCDDGVGLRGGVIADGGLHNIAIRAADLGGRCEIATPERGVSIKVVLPLARSAPLSRSRALHEPAER